MRRPELAPVLFVGLGLTLLSGFGGVEAAWAVPPAACCSRRCSCRSSCGGRGALPRGPSRRPSALCMVLASAHPGTLAPDPPEAAADRSLDPSALETFIVAVEGRDSPRAALNDPSLGPLLLWRSTSRRRAWASAPARSRDGSDLEEPRDVLVERALRAGYGWTLDLPRAAPRGTPSWSDVSSAERRQPAR